MEEEFIATIKLTTGEEIISKVSYMPEDDSLVLESPMAVHHIAQQKKNIHVNGFALTEWIHSTFEQMFVLPKQHVLTMTEVEDPRIKHFYTESVKRHVIELDAFKKVSNPQNFTRNMGKVGSVQNTKKLLEDLYKKS